jgi:endonuclease/exonuclease/phosphatase family metal-dependent hydrolase
VAELREALPNYFAVYGPNLEVDVGSHVRDGRAVDMRMEFGNMILSKTPILASRNVLLPRRRSIDLLNLQRGAIEALVDTPFGPVRFYSIHLDHRGPDERREQLGFLMQRVLGYPLEGGAISGTAELGFAEPPAPEAFVLMGDFNMKRGSPEYGLMVGERDGAAEGADPVDIYSLGDGLPEGAVSRVDDARPQDNCLIDFAFVEKSLAGRVGKVRIDREAMGSDHLPVWFDLA